MTGLSLGLPLPAGTTFVSATGGGALSGGRVQWSLGTLAATQSDQQQVVVAVDGGLAAGTVLPVDAALLTGSGTVAESARATAATAVGGSQGLGLGVEWNPDPVRPNEWSYAELTVTNRGAASLTGVVLEARIPIGISDIGPGVITGGGSCIEVVNNGLCDLGELARWSLGTLPAGASRSVALPLPVVANAAVRLVSTLQARVADDAARQSVFRQSVAVDGDGR